MRGEFQLLVGWLPISVALSAAVYLRFGFKQAGGISDGDAFTTMLILFGIYMLLLGFSVEVFIRANMCAGFRHSFVQRN